MECFYPVRTGHGERSKDGKQLFLHGSVAFWYFFFKRTPRFLNFGRNLKFKMFECCVWNKENVVKGGQGVLLRGHGDPIVKTGCLGFEFHQKDQNLTIPREITCLPQQQ